MPDLILRDVEATLLARVSRLAHIRGTSLEQALLELLDRGLASTGDPDGGLDDLATRVLQEAITALECVPSDPGFALIGRAAPAMPLANDTPDQAIGSAWTSPP